MKTLTIRGLPDEVHKKLKERAKGNRRSLNQEVVEELVQVVGRSKRVSYVEDLLSSADALYAKVEQPLSPEEIKEAVEDGRD